MRNHCPSAQDMECKECLHIIIRMVFFCFFIRKIKIVIGYVLQVLERICYCGNNYFLKYFLFEIYQNNIFLFFKIHLSHQVKTMKNIKKKNHILEYNLNPKLCTLHHFIYLFIYLKGLYHTCIGVGV